MIKFNLGYCCGTFSLGVFSTKKTRHSCVCDNHGLMLSLFKRSGCSSSSQLTPPPSAGTSTEANCRDTHGEFEERGGNRRIESPE